MTIIQKYLIFCMKRKWHQCMYSFSIGFGGSIIFGKLPTNSLMPSTVGFHTWGKASAPRRSKGWAKARSGEKVAIFRSHLGHSQIVYLGLSPCPVTVTTRIVMFLEGDPELNLHLPLASWEGGQPKVYLLFGLGRGISFQLFNGCFWFP